MANEEVTTGISWAVVAAASPTNLDSSYPEWMGWIDTTTNRVFLINDNTADNAVWQWMPDATLPVSFTPVIEGSTAAGAGTYTTQIGRWYRTGQTVHVHINLTWTAHTGTGNMLIGGLPSQPNTDIVQITTPEIQSITLPLLALCPIAKTRSDTKLDLVVQIANAITSPILMNGSGTIRLSMSYYL